MFFFANPLFKGYLTVEDLLSSTGTLGLFFEKKLINENQVVFHVESSVDGFLFSFSFQNNNFVLQRNNTVSILTIDDLDITNNLVSVWVVWSHTSLRIILQYGLGISNQKTAEVPTELRFPPREMINWARKNNLLPIEKYKNESDFRNKIYSSLQSIQLKIDKTNAYDAFWDITYKGNKIITKKPKKEKDIQKIVHGLLFDQMLMANIDIIPEYQTGNAGNLDFLLLGKLDNNNSTKLAIEFKNAHSSDLFSGITTQLPEYMEKSEAAYGAYCVLFYKGDFFSKPSDSLSELHLKLISKLKIGVNPHYENIRSFIYNLSKPKTASKK